ncbi:MAG: FtsK/SpoIIIE domain-containing protein [Lacisediminihabitans sp.]
MSYPADTRAGEVVRLRLPRSPEPPPRHPFPLLASLAPVVGSVLIWAITSSPFALVFALLGPVIAVAGFADARVQARRAARHERDRFAADLADLHETVRREHDRERERLRLRSPGSIALLGSSERDPERWHGALDRELPVVLGYGEIASGLVLDGDPMRDHDELVALRERAARLDGAPVVVDARLGIGVCGAPELASAVARGLTLQLANALPPETTGLALAAAEPWSAALPHRAGSHPAGDQGNTFGSALFLGVGVGVGQRAGSAPVGPGSAPAEALIAVARTPHDLPHRCRVVLSIGGARRAAVVAHPDPALLGDITVQYLSAEQAAETAELLSRAASTRGGGAGGLPERLAFGALSTVGVVGGEERQTMNARFLAGEGGPIAIDLVRDGPHAVIGGTTGSGKSELLLSWLLALAATHSPRALSFLLVDFKGGSAFAPIIGLPQVAGLVTDLDERSARRALQSLRAEVRHRERVLAEAGARSIDALAPHVELARLVIVVDEFAALVGDFVELHELFADLAARGRSLGIHLILCTQRPAGVVRDSVLANVPLRLSLRVNNRADSAAVVGTDAAATLPANPPGRVVLAIAGADPVIAQVAIVDSDDIQVVSERWADALPARRPWCPELPGTVFTHELPADLPGALPGELPGDRAGCSFGLLDLPDSQRQTSAVWNPVADGSLLILGGGGAGKSELLVTLAQAADGRIVPSLPEEAWDAVAAVVDSLRRGRAPSGVLLIDDLDVLVTRFGDEHRDAFGEMLSEILRTGGAAGMSLVLAARRLSGGLQSVLAGCESRVILRQPDRQEHLLVGGTAGLYRPDAPAGRGEWRGAELQVALLRDRPHRGARPPGTSARAITAKDRPLIVLTGRPGELTRRFADAVDLTRPGSAALQLDPVEPRVWVADPASWQARWSQLSLLRTAAPLLVDRCSLAELRAIVGQRMLPPPLDPTRETAWLLHPDGAVERVALPTPGE